MPSDPADEPPLCTDQALGYLRSRTRLAPGAPLLLDDAYRLAHLPLVAPEHPGVIARRAGTPYDRGRHPRVHSLVMPVPWEALAEAEAFRAVTAELRAASFAHKIAWDLMPRRRSRLHATLVGSLAVGPDRFALAPEQRRALADLGPFTVELRGLFSGAVNVGRLYLRVYPECREGENAIHRIQRALGRPPTDLYVVGLHNLVDDLSPGEAAALAGILERWWSRPVLRLRVSALWVLWAMDDLVLDAGIAEVVPLG